MIDSINHLMMHFNFVTQFPSDHSEMAISYNYPLVLVSYLIAAIAGYTGLSISQLIQERKSLQVHSTTLLILGSISMGMGIWAMHFIAMLAYSIEVKISYDMTITAVSVLPAILASWVTLTTMTRHKATNKRLSMQGLVIGLGIGAMHYIGMGAMIQQATPAYHLGLFVLSILIAWILGIFTLYLRFSSVLKQYLSKQQSDVVISLFWGLAVAGMHYTGMAAAFFTPGGMDNMPIGVNSEALVTPVTLIAVILIVSALSFSKFQHRLLSISIKAEEYREQMIEAIDEMNDGFVVTDQKNIITLINQQIYKLMPGSENSLKTGHSLESFLVWLTAELANSNVNDSKRENLVKYMLAFQSLENTMEIQLSNDKWLMVRQITTKSGSVMRIWTDISSIKKAEEAEYQENKMESMGRMVAGVAHEVNTPLGICLTLASQLDEESKTIRKKYNSDEVSQTEFENYLETTENISEIMLSNIRRAADLVRNFKQVAVDQSHLEIENIRIKSYTNQVIKTIHCEYKSINPDITVNCPEELEVKTTPGAYSQVIINLVNNSVIHAFNDIENPEININILKNKKDFEVHYTDNGVGMDQETIDKIFDPFFTTNRGKGGTGLGMHIVFNLITQKLKGRIKVESTLGFGSSFRIYLPI